MSSLRSFFYLFLLSIGCCACAGLTSTRPVRQMSYAGAAFEAATKANAEVNMPQSYQAAQDTLHRARAAYRAKKFFSALKLAIRSRLLSEEAEFYSLFREEREKRKARRKE